jgi:hypothetical protein
VSTTSACGFRRPCMATASSTWSGFFRSGPELSSDPLLPVRNDALSLTTPRPVLISPPCRLDACPVGLVGPLLAARSSASSSSKHNLIAAAARRKLVRRHVSRRRKLRVRGPPGPDDWI